MYEHTIMFFKGTGGSELIYRIAITVLSLLKRDSNGVPRYTFIKQHISDNKPTVVLFLVATFLLFLLINTSVISNNRLILVYNLNRDISFLESRNSQLEDELFSATTKLRLVSSRHELCSPDRPPKKIPDSTTSKPKITRKFVIDKLNKIKN